MYCDVSLLNLALQSFFIYTLWCHNTQYTFHDTTMCKHLDIHKERSHPTRDISAKPSIL